MSMVGNLHARPRKLAVLTYKVRSTSTLVYPHCRNVECACNRTLRSAAIPLLDKPFMRTDFSKRAFQSSAPTVWNSLPQTVLISDSLTVFKSRLETFLFNQAFTEHWSDLPPAPLKLRLYCAIEKFDYYYYSCLRHGVHSCLCQLWLCQFNNWCCSTEVEVEWNQKQCIMSVCRELRVTWSPVMRGDVSVLTVSLHRHILLALWRWPVSRHHVAIFSSLSWYFSDPLAA